MKKATLSLCTTYIRDVEKLWIPQDAPFCIRKPVRLDYAMIGEDFIFSGGDTVWTKVVT